VFGVKVRAHVLLGKGVDDPLWLLCVIFVVDKIR